MLSSRHTGGGYGDGDGTPRVRGGTRTATACRDAVGEAVAQPQAVLRELDPQCRVPVWTRALLFTGRGNVGGGGQGPCALFTAQPSKAGATRKHFQV